MQHFSFTFLSFLSVLFAFSLFSWCGILAFVVLPLSPFRSFVGVFLASVVLPSCAVFAFGSYPSSGVLVLPVCFAFVLSSCAVFTFSRKPHKEKTKKTKTVQKGRITTPRTDNKSENSTRRKKYKGEKTTARKVKGENSYY